MTVILLLFSVWDLEKDYPGIVPVKIAFGLCQVTFIISVFNCQMLTQHVFLPLGTRKILALVMIEKDSIVIYK